MTQNKGKIDKGWGFEIIWANNDKYSGKLLVFEKEGSKTSMLYHKDRSKSWFVNSGKFRLVYCDTKTGQYQEAILEEGKTVDIAELGPHQLEALVAGSVIFEVGMPDYEEDRFRISPGDTQKLLEEQKSNRSS
jgi:mannose-6-phosphate isomerase-like protein (cupin superfamily)